MAKFKLTKKKLISYGIQFLVLLIAVFGISKWQARNLLSEKTIAPDFTLSTLANETISLANYKGKKVVLYFFSPWCTVCKLSSHNIVALRNSKSKDKVAVFGVGMSYRSINEITAFAKSHKFNIPVLLGNSGISRDYKIKAFPTIYIIDEQGLVQDRVVGYTTEAGLRLRL